MPTANSLGKMGNLYTVAQCEAKLCIALITGYYANQTRSIKIDPWLKETKVLFVVTSDRLPSHPTSKDERATNSCFSFIGPYQCGVLMVIAG